MRPNPVTMTTGQQVAELLRTTLDSFVDTLRSQLVSDAYLTQSRFIIDEWAQFSEHQGAAGPWFLRQSYLAQRAQLRTKYSYSASYLYMDGRELRYFLRWYATQVQAKYLFWGELSSEQLEAYWTAQPTALSYRRMILARHLQPLLLWLKQRPSFGPSHKLEPLLHDYFEDRRLAMRGNGYGIVLTHRAEIVTRRHLVWLEQQGYLPAGTAAHSDVQLDAGKGYNDESQTLQNHFKKKAVVDLPPLLQQSLLDYVQHLSRDRKLVKHTVESSLRTNLALCRNLVEAVCDCFAQLRVSHLNDTVSSLISGPQHDLLRRRHQVQIHHSRLRGFLGYLYRESLIERDLASTLISPPCYRSSRPATVLSERQIHDLLESVDRSGRWGRRCYAIIVLMTTYGLRPLDVSQLRVENVYWRQQRIALVQNKTGHALSLPLLPIVAKALSDYLRHDRLPGLAHRRLFVSLSWPQQPVRRATISATVAKALGDCGLPWARAKHLRASLSRLIPR